MREQHVGLASSSRNTAATGRVGGVGGASNINDPSDRPAAMGAPERTRPSAVPLTILSGFLGSGKTTVLNRLLHNSAGLRIAVLVNEFGDVDIDGALVQGENGKLPDMVQLTNGCVCCSINTDLQAAVEKVLKNADGAVDHVVLETSGVTDPLPLIKTFAMTAMRAYVWLANVVTVVDSEAFSAECYGSAAARSQLTCADVILLNKVDLLPWRRTTEVENALRCILTAPNATVAGQPAVIRCSYGQAPLAAILATAATQSACIKNQQLHAEEVESVVQHLQDMDTWQEQEGGLASHMCSNACERHHHHQHHDDSFDEGDMHHGDHLEQDGLISMSFCATRPLVLARFQEFIAHHLPPSVIRAKGFLWFDVAEGSRYLLQLSGRRRFNFVEDEWPQGNPPKVQFVLIGQALDVAAIRASLYACLAPPDSKSALCLTAVQTDKLTAHIESDPRFRVIPASNLCPSVVTFGLVGAEWQGIRASDLNHALASAINASSPVFMTLTEVDGVKMLRYDLRDDSVAMLWKAIKDAAVQVLQQVFFEYYCCGSTPLY
eukprot:jgi/Chlat1/7289/Chrsp58S06921